MNRASHLAYGEIDQIEQSDIDGLGWQVTVRRAGTQTKGSGTSSSRDLAVRIALAESFEREHYQMLLRNQRTQVKWQLHTHPSSSGFAAGLDKKATLARAIFEGIERWAWSKWIDEQFQLGEIAASEVALSPLASELTKQFVDYEFFQQKLVADSGPFKELYFEVFLGFTDKGVFPGSRVSNHQNSGWEHAVIEAHRHLLIHRNHKDFSQYPYDRIHYFGNNKQAALKQINMSTVMPWPSPELSFIKVDDVHPFWFARAICKDFKSWNLGSVDRFVY